MSKRPAIQSNHRIRDEDDNAEFSSSSADEQFSQGAATTTDHSEK
jgi:hypothetical protein